MRLLPSPLYYFLFSYFFLFNHVFLLFGALPPAVMNFLFAQRYQQEPEKVSAIVMIGNSIAVLTLPLALLYVLPTYT